MNNSDSEGLPTANLHQPLTGRAVLLTRPSKQSEEIANRLEVLGAKVIQTPMIAIVAPESWAALDQAIEKLDSYDSIIFTSSNGVTFFFQRLQQQHPLKVIQIKKMLVCAIGKATAKALAETEITASLVAQDSKAEGLLKAIIDYFGGENRLQGQAFLFPRAQIAREVLPEELRKLGAIVNTVETYQTIRPSTENTVVIELLENRAIDVITFTSSSTVNNFISLIGEERVAELCHNVIIACIGPITAATAREYKLTNIIQPATYTANALVDAIIEAFTSK